MPRIHMTVPIPEPESVPIVASPLEAAPVETAVEAAVTFTVLPLAEGAIRCYLTTDDDDGVFLDVAPGERRDRSYLINGIRYEQCHMIDATHVRYREVR